MPSIIGGCRRFIESALPGGHPDLPIAVYLGVDTKGSTLRPTVPNGEVRRHP